MAVHKIRLAGPWQYQQSSSICTTVNLPFRQAADAPPSILKRRFHSPTGIDSTTLIEVALLVHSATARVRLNGQPLEKSGSTQTSDPSSTETVYFPVTGRLQPYNELEVHLSSAVSEGDGSMRGVELQITSAEDER